MKALVNLVSLLSMDLNYAEIDLLQKGFIVDILS